MTETTTEPLWTGQAMVDAMGARPVHGLPEAVTGISIDTRTLQPGEAYFAIKGDRFDGHDFATAAVAAGASLLVVSEARLPALGRLTIPMLVVDDVLDALGRLGAAARARSKAKVVAVTGSAGKTTTKEALRLALAPSGKVHASAASFNNHWGVPLTLARMPADTDFAVFEIGMNHPGEITPLVALVRPHVAIVTLIAAAHLGYFEDLDAIARAKAEIFTGVEPGGHALINRDDPRFNLLQDLARQAGVNNIHGFGAHERAKVRLLNAKYFDDGSAVTARVFDEDVTAMIGAPGRHMVQNCLAVLGAAHLAGADLAMAGQSLASLRPEKGRGQRHILAVGEGAFTLIDESYNANPTSMEVALELLASAPIEGHGRRIAVLGDMLELGDHARALHEGLAGAVTAAGVDRLYLAGPEMAALSGAVPDDLACEYQPTVDDLTASLIAAPQPGDVFMVKSSNGVGFSRIVKAFLDTYPAVAE